MLEGFKVIRNKDTLSAAKGRMHSIHAKLLKGKGLTEKEEKDLKLYLWSMNGLDRKFRDDIHRIQLINQWWKDAKPLNKKLKEQEEMPE